MLFEALADVVLNGVLYALIGTGMYHASKSSRHLALLAAVIFVAAPFFVSAFSPSVGIPCSLSLAILACAAIGGLYRRLCWWLQTLGMGQAQLLLFSIVATALGEQLIDLCWGPTSKSLESFMDGRGTSLPAAAGTANGFVVAGTVTLTSAVFVLSRPWIRRRISALWENPVGIRLLGINALALETLVCAASFALMSIAGILWSLGGRVKPSMIMDVALSGAMIVVASLALPRFRYTFIWMGIALALCRVMVVRFFEQDWNFTSTLLIAALIFWGRHRAAFIEETRS